MNGVAAAGVYVVMAGALSRLVFACERGLAQTAFGASGAVGEGVANLIVPYVAINIASGWRQSTDIMAADVALIRNRMRGIPSIGSAGTPGHGKTAIRRSMLTNLQLWGFILVYSGFIISLRIFGPWLAFYAADIYTRAECPWAGRYCCRRVEHVVSLGRVIGVPAVGSFRTALSSEGSLETRSPSIRSADSGSFELLPMGIKSTTILGTSSS